MRGHAPALALALTHRWLDRAGVTAQASVPGQLQGIAQSQKLGTDGLWAKLRGDTTRMVLLLADSVTGLLWPPVAQVEPSLSAGDTAREHCVDV